MIDFTNKVVLVTGGSTGIGRGICDEFILNGATVISGSRREIQNIEGDRKTVTLDITDIASIELAVQKIINTYGKIDVLVNNAGVFKMGKSDLVSSNEWEHVLNTNLVGTFNVSKSVWPHMKKQKYGKIVNIGSLLSHTSFPERAVYGSSKSAIMGLTRTLGIEWIKYGINVNSVSPGMIDIGTNHPSGKVTDEKILTRIPKGRKGTPKDVANAVMFLASDLSSYVVGEDIKVDGGWLANGYFE